MQDIEFTIEQGALYMLQTRNGKRSAAGDGPDRGRHGGRGRAQRAGRAADPASSPAQLDQLLHPQFDPARGVQPVAKGVNASPGAAVGAVVFTADEAEPPRRRPARHVILVRDETTPDDFHGMMEAEGILTARGGKTSHAAIVAVGMGKPAVCGVDRDPTSWTTASIRIGGRTFREGDRISIDGTTGRSSPATLRW